VRYFEERFGRRGKSRLRAAWHGRRGSSWWGLAMRSSEWQAWNVTDRRGVVKCGMAGLTLERTRETAPSPKRMNHARTPSLRASSFLDPPPPQNWVTS